jgi:hypothetical protein
LHENLRDVDDEVVADIYEETAPLTFTRQTVKVTIFEYSIISDVSAQVVAQPAAKKGRTTPQPQVKINKQQVNKVTRQIEDAGKCSFSAWVTDLPVDTPKIRHIHLWSQPASVTFVIFPPLFFLI